MWLKTKKRFYNRYTSYELWQKVFYFRDWFKWWVCYVFNKIKILKSTFYLNYISSGKFRNLMVSRINGPIPWRATGDTTSHLDFQQSPSSDLRLRRSLGRFATLKGSLRSPRGQLVASLHLIWRGRFGGRVLFTGTIRTSCATSAVESHLRF